MDINGNFITVTLKPVQRSRFINRFKGR